MTLTPVLVLIDVEPNRFFTTENAPWSGFERSVEVMADIRRALALATGREPHFIWLVRADEQIAANYGSAGWAFEHYRQVFETLLATGDELGLHVHAYRWEVPARRWVEDYGNQEWVEHCVRTGIRAFEQHFGRSPASFSMGMDWTNQATIRLVGELNVRYELSTVLGKEAQPFPPRDTYTGVAPDCGRIPERPYRPCADDFRCAVREPANGIWLMPQSSRVTRIVPSWKRGLWDLVHLRPVAPLRTQKFFLQDDPAALRTAVDAMLHRLERPYLTFAVRTHEFVSPETIAIIRRNLEGPLQRPDAQRFVFTTPAEALRCLGYV